MRQILRYPPRVLAAVALLWIPTMSARAQQPGATNTAIEGQLRQAIREYDDALRRGDVEAIGRFYAQEYFFVNPRSQRLTRTDRLANFREGRTVLDSVVHAPQERSAPPVRRRRRVHGGSHAQRPV